MGGKSYYSDPSSPDSHSLLCPELPIGAPRGEEGEHDGGVGPLVRGQWGLVPRHVSADPTRAAGIDQDVFLACSRVPSGRSVCVRENRKIEKGFSQGEESYG